MYAKDDDLRFPWYRDAASNLGWPMCRLRITFVRWPSRARCRRCGRAGCTMTESLSYVSVSAL
jgi:hypothetical protein